MIDHWTMLAFGCILLFTVAVVPTISLASCKLHNPFLSLIINSIFILWIFFSVYHLIGQPFFVLFCSIVLYWIRQDYWVSLSVRSTEWSPIKSFLISAIAIIRYSVLYYIVYSGWYDILLQIFLYMISLDIINVFIKVIKLSL